MLKFLDDVFTGVIYLFLVAATIVITGFCFYYYPTLTSVVLIAFILSPIIGWLDKKILKINIPKITFNKPQKSLWQSFKNGVDKGFCETKSR